jgi:hypothetical protein
MTQRIVSAVPGRLRVKDPRLSDDAAIQKVIDSASRELPVLETRANSTACSVVILYDARVIPLPEMRQRTEDVLAACLTSRSAGSPLLKSPPRKWRRSPRMRFNRYAKIGAMLSLAALLGFAGSGRRRPHIVTGWVFVACVCAHMAVFRRSLAR